MNPTVFGENMKYAFVCLFVFCHEKKKKKRLKQFQLLLMGVIAVIVILWYA